MELKTQDGEEEIFYQNHGTVMELKIQDDDEEIFTLEDIMNHESLSQER